MDPTNESASLAPPRRRRWPAVLAVLALLPLVALAAGYAWLGSESALRYVLARTVAASDGRLAVEGAEGSLLSVVRASRITWHGEAVDVDARQVALALRLLDLLSRRIVLEAPGAASLSILVRNAGGSPAGLPASLALPLAVDVRNLHVERLEWATPSGGGSATGIAFSYAGDASAHRLSDLRFVTSAGTLTGGAEMGASAPFALRGEVSFAGAGEWSGARAALKLAGPLDRLDVDAAATLRESKITARMVATPFAAAPFANAEIDATGVDVARWSDGWPATDLTVKVVARPDGGGFAGKLTARNAAAGPLDAGRVPAESLAANVAWHDQTLVLDDAQIGIAGGGVATGRIALPTGGGASEWALQLRDVDLARIQSALRRTRLSGTLAATVTGTRQSVSGDLREDARRLDFAALVEGERVRVEHFRARAGGGELAGRGTVELARTRAFSVSARASGFDPSLFGDVPPGKLTGTIDASGTLAPAWEVAGSATLEAGSRFADTAVSGKARGHATPVRASDLDVDLRVAGASIALKGAWGGTADRLRFTVNAPRLADLRPAMLRVLPQWPDALAGAIKLDGTLSGAPRNPGLVLDAHAKALQWGATLRVAAIDVAAKIAPGAEGPVAYDRRELQITVSATGLVAPRTELESARIEVGGTLARHHGAIAIAGAQYAVAAGFDGGLSDRGPSEGIDELAWSGTLVNLTSTGGVPLVLESPASLVVSRSRVVIGAARIAIAEGHAEIDLLSLDAGRIDTRGSFRGVPVSALARLAGSPLPFASTLVIGGDWSIAAAPKLNGTFTVKRESGDGFVAEGTGRDASSAALGITELDLAGQLVDDALDTKLRVRTSSGGTADATFALDAGGVPGSLSTAAAMRATLRADMPTLQPLQPLLGTTAVIDGRLRADIEARGTLAQPAYDGTLVADALRFALPQYGVQLQDGRLRARLVDRSIALDELSLRGGAGRFVAEGTLARARDDPARASGRGVDGEVRWRADDFTVVSRPDLEIVAAGNGTLALEGRRLALAGVVDIARGRVAYAPVVEGRLSSDVVIVGRPRPGADAGDRRDVPLALDLDVGFGSEFRFSGDGLDTRLEGRVRVTNDAAGSILAHGTIRAVDGTYELLGQRLVIDRGNVIFNGRADNPGLDVVAVRRNLAVEAGVEVQGSVRSPRVRLVSNPPVSDSEKLSWLLMGQGLDRASTADVAALSAASASLLLGGARSLRSQVGDRLGVDEISIRGSPAARGGAAGQVLALGKKISDRLSIVYEQGLTVATNALRVEYALSRALTLRAEAGTVSSVGIVYRWIGN